VLSLSPNQWLCAEGANKEVPYPYRILSIGVWRNKSQGSSTYELARSESQRALALRKGCGHMEVGPSLRAIAHTVLNLRPEHAQSSRGFLQDLCKGERGPVDSFKGFQQEIEEPFRLIRRSIQRLGGRRTLLR
jgi:hypothetical protein